jgi:hypothetical protein
MRKRVVKSLVTCLGLLISSQSSPASGIAELNLVSNGVSVSISGQYLFYESSRGADLVRTTLQFRNSSRTRTMMCDATVEYLKGNSVRRDETFSLWTIPPKSIRYKTNFGALLDASFGDFADWDSTRISEVSCKESFFPRKNGAPFIYKFGSTRVEGDYLRTTIIVTNKKSSAIEASSQVLIFDTNGAVVDTTSINGTGKCGKGTLKLMAKEKIKCHVNRRVDTPFSRFIITWTS